MTDDDLLLLINEELRLYREYRVAVEEESRRPRQVKIKRDAWEKMYGKLKEALPPERRREIMQKHVSVAQKKRRNR